MDIRNILHKKKKDKHKKILFIAIGGFILILIILLIGSIQKNNNKITYKIGDQINTSGTITTTNNYPANTHKISNNNYVFGLKSSSINLNNLNNQKVILNGIVDDIDTKYPILNIKNIQEPKSKLIIVNNRYFFTQELISFDFSQDTDIKAQKIDNYIQIYYQDQPVMTVETFVCNKVTPTQDCEQLIYTYTDNLNEMFTTYLGYTFYKNKKNSRITFNDNILGYIVKTTDNNFLLNMSHMINIIDSKFITENKQKLIKDECTDLSGTQFKHINNIKTQIIDQDLIKLEINGDTTTDQNIQCKLTINIRKNREIQNKILKYIK